MTFAYKTVLFFQLFFGASLAIPARQPEVLTWSFLGLDFLVMHLSCILLLKLRGGVTLKGRILVLLSMSQSKKTCKKRYEIREIHLRNWVSMSEILLGPILHRTRHSFLGAEWWPWMGYNLYARSDRTLDQFKRTKQCYFQCATNGSYGRGRISHFRSH